MSDDITKERVEATVRNLDENLTETGRSWYPATFLVASVLIGPDPASIAVLLEMEPTYAGMLAERSRACRAWPPSIERYSGETGGIQFWMDCSVLNGDMETTDGENYNITEEGRRHVEGLLRKKP